MNLVELSKEISYALRHAPWEYELELDELGFVPIAQLLHALNESGAYEREITQGDLEEIIATSEKKRHEIVDDKIRALYGQLPRWAPRSP
jgi:putative RNA 2'-phosphotransferase